MGKHSSNSSDNPNRKAAKSGLRSKSTILRLNMYKNGGSGPSDGNVAGPTYSKNLCRILPNRKWFGNTRTVSSYKLEEFRSAVETHLKDPLNMLLQSEKLPNFLINQVNVSDHKQNVFASMNSQKMLKRPNIQASDIEQYIRKVEEKYIEGDSSVNDSDSIDDAENSVQRDLFSKGQSKRIWGELYKVLDCSDVVLEVIDARDIPGTRCEHVENYLKSKAQHKHLVIVINKCDLVPSWVVKGWLKILSANFPVVAFHASLTNSFGKGALINLLRQFSMLHADKRQISVGVIGYPNCGKSSVINTLIGTNSCKSAPIPGETKIWQYVSLMRRIYLIDSPGIVYDTGDDDSEKVLKGVIRAERLSDPSDFVEPILNRVNRDYIKRRYDIENWENYLDFLRQLSFKQGKLSRGGEPDIRSVSINLINDWQRGKIPHFVSPDGYYKSA
jgi:nuclear GTP-binding protein